VRKAIKMSENNIYDMFQLPILEIALPELQRLHEELNSFHKTEENDSWCLHNGIFCTKIYKTH
jgi:hypothetical protein